MPVRYYLRYTLFECDGDEDGGSCEEVRTYVDGGEALAHAIGIARSGKRAQIDVYLKEVGGE